MKSQSKVLDYCPASIHGRPMSKTVDKVLPKDKAEKKSTKDTIWDEIKFFSKLFGFLMVFYTLVFGHYKIPSESMQPTLEVGDHLYVSKFAYGYSAHSVPLNLHKLPIWPKGKLFSRLPDRGDVAVFRNPNEEIVMIKRVIGLPGDEIVMSRGRLYINGDMIARKEIETLSYLADNGPVPLRSKLRGKGKFHQRWGNQITVTSYEEALPGESSGHSIYEISDKFSVDNTRPVTVPEGHVFFMGDNRDRSKDSRVPGGPGFVPLDHLIGRADMMMFTFKKCPDEPELYCPPRRYFQKL